MEKDKKLIIEFLIGNSCAGKSTYSLEKCTKDSTWKRVNKDDIRAEYPSGIKESKVLRIEEEIVQNWLEKGYNVILDNTHLNPIHLDRVKKRFFKWADVTVNDFFLKVPLETLLERARKRPNTTNREGKEVTWESIIMRQRDEFIGVPKIVQDENLPRCVIFDHDGTLCHVSPNRSPYDGTHSHEDTKNEIVCEYAGFIKEKGYTVFIFSGLEDKYRTQRENWLNSHGVNYDFLYMRKTGDYRKDYVIKKELYEEHVKDKFFVHVIVDDRPMMQRHWISEGFQDRLFSVGNPFKEF